MADISEEFIIRFFNGKLNKDETVELDKWISSSSANLELFETYRNIWLGTASGAPKGKFDPVPAWDKVSHKIDKGDKYRRITDYPDKYKGFRKVLQIAAMFLVFISAGAVTSWVIFSKQKDHKADQYCEIVAPPGSKSLITLPDGSKAWINAGSKLSYTGDFNQSDRVVKLEGEGYFSVTSNKAKPFIVQTPYLRVRAYGTIFNVKAYPDEKTVETTLVDGIVEIEAGIKERSDKTYKYTLRPKQNIIYHIDSGLSEQKSDNGPSNEEQVVRKDENIRKEVQVISNIKPELYTSWKDDKWVIEGMPLDKLAVLMGRRYNSRIEIKDESLKLYKFTGTIQNETLEQVLVILSMTTPLEYSIGKGNVSWMVNKNLEKKLLQDIEKIVVNIKRR